MKSLLKTIVFLGFLALGTWIAQNRATVTQRDPIGKDQLYSLPRAKIRSINP